MGLQLPVSKRLVELMGGAMGFESQTGTGTLMYYHLPLWAPSVAGDKVKGGILKFMGSPKEEEGSEVTPGTVTENGRKNSRENVGDQGFVMSHRKMDARTPREDFASLKSRVEGLHVVYVDDSLLRQTTVKYIMRRLGLRISLVRSLDLVAGVLANARSEVLLDLGQSSLASAEDSRDKVSHHRSSTIGRIGQVHRIAILVACEYFSTFQNVQAAKKSLLSTIASIEQSNDRSGAGGRVDSGKTSFSLFKGFVCRSQSDQETGRALGFDTMLLKPLTTRTVWSSLVEMTTGKMRPLSAKRVSGKQVADPQLTPSSPESLSTSSSPQPGTVASATSPSVPSQLDDDKKGSIPEVILKSLSGKKVLVVDDMLLNRKVGVKSMEKYGMLAESVGSGKEALTKLQPPHEFYFVLMDLQMPEMDGFETTRLIRKLESEANAAKSKDPIKPVPIIAFTADMREESKHAAMECGMDGYLTKPIDDEKIAQIVDVVDTGIGIEEKAQKFIFNPFGQADSSDTRAYGGMGLQLPVSKRLVELMGGAMGFESQTGTGTLMYYHLPLWAPSVAGDKVKGGILKFMGSPKEEEGSEVTPGTVTENGRKNSRENVGDQGFVMSHRKMDARTPREDFASLKSRVEGLHVVYVDDSLLRQTTVKYIMRRLGLRISLVRSLDLVAGVLANARSEVLLDLGQSSLASAEDSRDKVSHHRSSTIGRIGQVHRIAILVACEYFSTFQNVQAAKKSLLSTIASIEQSNDRSGAGGRVDSGKTSFSLFKGFVCRSQSDQETGRALGFDTMLLKPLTTRTVWSSLVEMTTGKMRPLSAKRVSGKQVADPQLTPSSPESLSTSSSPQPGTVASATSPSVPSQLDDDKKGSIPEVILKSLSGKKVLVVS
ncbi:hypothetical protein CBR_g38370 [Chara braunii]|uniref:Histidine kinase n=1 Tax=Chara braunii TaxID=69332 RepID=A0A388JNI7_CHABU|nr:hypothetical protein CBR_g38370 [Chara braunii]|eukprot:GBG59341.1 hypothetical protein CBR_g38370 [Chara braunii]